MKTQTQDKATAVYSAKLVLEYLESPPFIHLHGETPAKHQRDVIRAVEALLVAAETLKTIIGANDSYGDVIGGKLVSNAKSALAHLTSIQKGQA